jgi:hypothetical protein
MAELRRRRDTAEADLAALAPAPKIVLHPAASRTIWRRSTIWQQRSRRWSPLEML